MLRKDIIPWESEQHNLFPYATDIAVLIRKSHNKFYTFLNWYHLNSYNLRDFKSVFL